MVIDYKDIEILINKNTILKHVNLQIEEGEMVYLIGAVGSGKSTLLRSMYGEAKCRGAKAQVLDYNLLKLRTSQQPDLRRKLGIVFQDFRLMSDRTVGENLDFVLRATEWYDKEERKQRTTEVLEMVRLTNKVDWFPHELSGGEQQRVSIARALLNHPCAILADEPTGNLDQENGELVLAILDEIRRQNKTAIIISTHNMQWMDFFPGRSIKVSDNTLTYPNN
jgi:cell division transport system ATP-binding protein